MDHHYFSAFLEYIYTGKTKFSQEVLSGLESIRDFYGIPPFEHNSLTKELSSLLLKSKTSDVILLSQEGDEFHAHKCILSARCEYQQLCVK